jgi:hypothetical protein
MVILGRLHLAQSFVSSHKIIHEPAHPEFDRDSQMQGIKSAETLAECVPLQQGFRQGKLGLSYRDFEIARSDVVP